MAKQGDLKFLRKSWNDLCQQSGIDPAKGEGFREKLLRDYDGRGRHYHTTVHLEQLLRSCDALVGEMKDVAAVRWAIFYHDVVYRSRRKDNEEASALRAIEEMTSLGVPGRQIQKAADIIRRTRHHDGEGADRDTLLMLDMDLAILGTEPDAYREYCKQVRREYRWVPGPLYRKGRAEVLQSFLQRPRIFYSEHFFPLFEAQARKNLQAEIEELGG
jgi:predicted metal-dependent HD superfamily phosphohydrolase